CMQPLQLPYSF
nr:immunoglobulin light chain junction region [Macaca mulatta]